MRELNEKTEKNKLTKQSKGITLIALVITIIILLILAGVAVATLTGDNGLLQKATAAKQENEEAKELELIKLAVGAAKIKGEGTITANNLSNELKHTFGDNENITETSNYIYYKGYRIYEDGKLEQGYLLPDEYERVEYIESSGKQYIITDIIPKNSIGVYAKVSTNDVINNSNIIGAKGTGDSRFFVSIKEETANYGWNQFFKTNISVSSNVIHTLELNYYNSREYLFNNEVVYTITDNLDSRATRPMYIFTVNWEGTTNGNAIIKLYDLKVTEETTIKYNFVPCFNKISKIIGLYDIVNDQFYSNKGSGTFGYETEDGTYVAPQ